MGETGDTVIGGPGPDRYEVDGGGKRLPRPTLDRTRGTLSDSASILVDVNLQGVHWRVLGTFLVGLVWAVSFSAIADAKGQGPLTSYVVVTGPNLRHPLTFHATGTAPKGYRGEVSESFDNLATRLGVLGGGATAKPMTAPDASELGVRYDVSFFLSFSQATVREVLYPFAPQGPVAYLPPGQEQAFIRMFGKTFLFTGWCRVFEGNVVRDELMALGATPYVTSPVEPSTRIVEHGTSAPTFILVAVGSFVLALSLLSVAYARSRRIAT